MSTPWSRSRAQVLVPGVLLALVIVVAFGWLATQVRPAPSRPDRTVIVTSGSWEPYVGRDLPDGGPVTRIVVDALAARGYQAEVRWTSWPAGLASTRRGAVAGTFPFVGTAERREDFLVSDPIVDFEYVLFARRVGGELPAVRTAADIGELRVARIEGYEYWPELQSAVRSVTTYATSRDAFEALVRGEVDLVPEGRQSGMALLGSGALAVDRDQIAFLPPAGNPILTATRPLSLLMPRDRGNEQIMDEFNRGLREIRATDVYADATEELESGVSPVEVTLVHAAGSPAVRLRTADGRWLLTPTGTRARVVSWPDAYVEPVSRLPEVAGWLSATLLTGPSAGRLVEVRPQDVEVVP